MVLKAINEHIMPLYDDYSSISLNPKPNTDRHTLQAKKEVPQNALPGFILASALLDKTASSSTDIATLEMNERTHQLPKAVSRNSPVFSLPIPQQLSIQEPATTDARQPEQDASSSYNPKMPSTSKEKQKMKQRVEEHVESLQRKRLRRN